MEINCLKFAVRCASIKNKVIYFYDCGNFQLNDKGLTDVIAQGGHNIILEIDCTGQDIKDILDENGRMYDANIDEILENYDLSILNIKGEI